MERNLTAMDATNEKAKAKVSTNHIPEHLAFSILSRLPIKSVKRFGCCKKSWNNLFENPSFMSMYRDNFFSNYDDSPLLFLHTVPPSVRGADWDSTLYLLSGERFENRVKLDWPRPLLENVGYNMVLGSGSINGTLFIMNWGKISLWNPATEEFKVIPPSPAEYAPPSWYPGIELQGFGYDQVNDDYKVIRCISYFRSEDDGDGRIREDLSRQNVYPLPLWEIYRNDPTCRCEHHMWEIYSLRSNSWRKLDHITMNCSLALGGSQVYLDGMCHWFGHTRDYKKCLVSFDLSNEVLFTTPIPSWVKITAYLGLPEDDNRAFVDHVVIRSVALNGSVGLISNRVTTTIFNVSILGEIGVKDSWIRLYTFGPLPLVVHTIGVGQNGEIFFRKEDDELIWFSLKTYTTEHLGFKGYWFTSKTGIYRESFLPIRGLNN